jgi:hypothetical protein
MRRRDFGKASAAFEKRLVGLVLGYLLECGFGVADSI